MKIGDRVRWLGAKEGSWAGAGFGSIVDFEGERAYFPNGKPASKDGPARGPAICVKLDGERGHTVWVEPGDVMPELVVAA